MQPQPKEPTEGPTLNSPEAPFAADGQSRKEPVQHGTILVKIGGSTLGSHDTTLHDLIALQKRGMQPIVVHGGGKVITEWMDRQGVRSRFVRGLRVTDGPSLDIVVAVLTGLINKQLVSSILALGGKAIGMSGVDGGMLRAKVMDPELGQVGEVVSVDPGPVNAAVEAGYMPIIAPVAVNLDGDPPVASLLNVNADTAAGAIAAAVAVEKLIFMTDVDGVLDASRRLIPRLTERQARGLMESNIIAGGMIPKIGACLMNTGNGRSTHIVDGRKPNMLMNILDGETLGTRVG